MGVPVLVEAVMVAVVVERANARAKATATDVCAPLCTHMPSSRDGDRSAENWSLEEEQEGRAVAAGRR